MAGEITTDNDLNLDANQPQTGGNFFQDIFNDPQKRLYAIIGISVFLILIFSVFFFANKGNENQGKLVPLVQEIDQARAFEIVAKLKSVNIESKIEPSEKPGEYVVKVYDKAIESAYLSLSRTTLLEDDGYGLFDTNDWAASDYDKRIKLTRAINGDLSRIISRMEGLRSAIVRVNIPEQQLFSELQTDTTATVQVELENDGDELSKSQIKSIVNLLRGYVPNLDKEKVSIVDTQGRNYNAFKEENEADTEEFIEEVQKINSVIETRIAKYLNVVLGASEYEVSVSASISREKVEQQQTIYSEGAVGSRQTSGEELNSGDKGSPGQASSGGKSYNSKSTNETLLPSFEQKNTTYLPGRVTDVTVALAIDKSIPANISVQQLRESIAAIVGPQTSSDKIKITVVDMHAKENQPKAPSKSGGIMTAINNFLKGGLWSVITKIFSIIAIIVGLLIVAIIGLNFLNAASNRNYVPEVDPNLSNEFDEILNDYGDNYSDYGEGQALAQQEELLKEMMNQQSSPKQEEKSIKAQNNNYEFDDLLNNFQSVASSKPDALAKKIQVWLDEE